MQKVLTKSLSRINLSTGWRGHIIFPGGVCRTPITGEGTARRTRPLVDSCHRQCVQKSCCVMADKTDDKKITDKKAEKLVDDKLNSTVMCRLAKVLNFSNFSSFSNSMHAFTS